MPILIKDIKADILQNFVSDLYFFTTIQSSVQTGPYINISGFIAFLQDNVNTKSILTLEKPITFGLKNQYNLTTTTLEISY